MVEVGGPQKPTGAEVSAARMLACSIGSSLLW
ncbi:hypothetical protein PR003_g26287 [Phytophthora rubi]|uniref:Uncharacterized protein n=1 Tax=Phytophthora rubi TaxID=129364 RepID=A0A6A4C9W5_9STRA|nr:hypothetical protein PR003_g26287 [Phytophthora rubi]